MRAAVAEASRPAASTSGSTSCRATLAAMALLFGVSASAQERAINLLDSSVIGHGSALFQKNCAVGYCHGSEGRSARGPALRDRVWAPRDFYRITHDGLPGTSMPPWKDVLSAQDIWAVTAYVMTLSKTPVEPANAVIAIEAAEEAPKTLTGEAKRGQDLFFDLNRQKRCGLCHQVGDLGTAIGPNLAVAAAAKSAAELERDILDPGKDRAFGFELTQITTRGGETIEGILADRTPDAVKIYDVSALPPVLRTMSASEVRRLRTRKGRSPMPNGWESVYSGNEIQAIVSFLKGQ